MNKTKKKGHCSNFIPHVYNFSGFFFVFFGGRGGRFLEAARLLTFLAIWAGTYSKLGVYSCSNKYDTLNILMKHSANFRTYLNMLKTAQNK